MYEDSTRVATATRQIPVSELLARHRGEQAPASPAWEPPTANETTDVIPVIRDEVGYDYYDDYATQVIPVVEVVDEAAPVEDEPEQELADLEADTEQIPADDRPSGEIYIRELLKREGRLPREQRRRQAPKIAAAAAGVAALCGAVAASIVHIQAADSPKSDAAGPGVPLTVVDNGGPRGQALDAPLAPRSGSDQVTNDNTAGGNTTPTTQTKVRVAPYVTATQKAPGAVSSGTNNTPPPSTSSPAPSNPSTGSTSSPAPTTTTAPTPSPGSSGSQTPPSTSTPPSSSSGSSGSGSSGSGGLLGGLLNPITGLLGG